VIRSRYGFRTLGSGVLLSDRWTSSVRRRRRCPSESDLSVQAEREPAVTVDRSRGRQHDRQELRWAPPTAQSAGSSAAENIRSRRESPGASNDTFFGDTIGWSPAGREVRQVPLRVQTGGATCASARSGERAEVYDAERAGECHGLPARPRGRHGAWPGGLRGVGGLPRPIDRRAYDIGQGLPDKTRRC